LLMCLALALAWLHAVKNRSRLRFGESKDHSHGLIEN
jgi:hypothetical protein